MLISRLLSLRRWGHPFKWWCNRSVLTSESRARSTDRLVNRRAFSDAAATRLVSGLDERAFIVAALERDRFKMLGDEHGYPFGDRVLIAVRRSPECRRRCYCLRNARGGKARRAMVSWQSELWVSTTQMASLSSVWVLTVCSIKQSVVPMANETKGSRDWGTRSLGGRRVASRLWDAGPRTTRDRSELGEGLKFVGSEGPSPCPTKFGHADASRRTIGPSKSESARFGQFSSARIKCPLDVHMELTYLCFEQSRGIVVSCLPQCDAPSRNRRCTQPQPPSSCGFPSFMSISRIKSPIDGDAEPMVGSRGSCGSLSTSGRPRHAVTNLDAPSATISNIVDSGVVQSFPMCRSAADSENTRTFSAGVVRAWTARRCR